MAELKFDPDRGVVVPTTREVRDDTAAGFVAAFRVNDTDQEANTDPAAPLGQVVDLLTAEVEAKNAELAFIANQYNPESATGVFLDGLAALYGLTRKLSEPTVVTCQCRGLRGTVIPFGAIVQDDSGRQLRMMTGGGVTIGDAGTVEAPFACVEHGPIEVGAGTVTKIVTVVAGWDAVDNAAAGITGRDIEHDGELLTRMRESYAINANGTVWNIQANLSQLDGVIDCVVLENYTNETQTQYSVNLGAHSIAVCIVGGDDTEIARTIFERKSGGCGTNGETEVTYIDEEHYNATYVYKIIRPTSKDFKIRIEFFSEGMSDDEKRAVVDAVVADALGEAKNPRVKLATTVYSSRFYGAIQGATSEPVKAVTVGFADGAMGSSVDVPANVSPAVTDASVELVFSGG